MRKVILNLGLILCLTSSVFAGSNSEIKHILFQNPRAEFRAQLQQSFNSDEKPTHGKQKSVGKGVLFSAVVPGAGQVYSGSYLKGILFLGVEIAAIVLNVNYNNKGSDYEDEFEAFADAEWSEDSYWDWMAQISSIDRNNLQALRDYEHDTFSHFLPENKNQQYYENVGKYNQFIYGWREFREDILGNRLFTFADYQSGHLDGEELYTILSTRYQYTLTRKESNDNFKKASTMATIIMFNHVISAVDAGLTLKRHNRRITAKANIYGRMLNDQLIPVLFVGVSW